MEMKENDRDEIPSSNVRERLLNYQVKYKKMRFAPHKDEVWCREKFTVTTKVKKL